MWPNQLLDDGFFKKEHIGKWLWEIKDGEHLGFSPYGKSGDVLWVRETWRIISWGDGDPFRIQYKDMSVQSGVYLPEENTEHYCNQSDKDCFLAGLPRDRDGIWRFNAHNAPTKWRPSIFMPKDASRIKLKITNVRVERVQDITEEDAIAEGISLPNYAEQAIKDVHYPEPSAIYADLWESINGKGSWEKNPWVWVIEFEKI